VADAEQSRVGGSFLIVDDDEAFRERLGQALRRRRFDVRTAANFDEALRFAKLDAPDYALLDLRMPGRSGFELADALLAIRPTIRIALLTGVIDPKRADGSAAGMPVVRKPADVEDILAAFGLGSTELDG
jgi:two-component system response regulator RegA